MSIRFTQGTWPSDIASNSVNLFISGRYVNENSLKYIHVQTIAQNWIYELYFGIGWVFETILFDF
jgi:hypothetical protein